MNHKFLRVLFVLLSVSCFTIQAQQPFTCGTPDTNLPDSLVRLMGLSPGQVLRARQAAGDQYVCRLAIEIDSDTYLTYDKDTNRIKEVVLKQIALVSPIFERDINTRISVVFIHINKDPATDPYAGEANIYTLFNRFDTGWEKSFRAVPYDKRLYLYSKSVTGGASGLGALGGKTAIANIGTSIIAHELGHTFNSPHTHSCQWAGGPIDYCAAIEGDCYRESLEYRSGTIMSYCRDQLTVDPRCQLVMLDHAAANFPKRSRPDLPPVLPTNITLTGSSLLIWEAVPMADRYAIEVATDAAFTQVIRHDTVNFTGYSPGVLPADRFYYVRLQSLSLLGNSPFSAGSRLQFDSSGPAGPRLLTPLRNARLFGTESTAVRLTFEPVTGATGYEVEGASQYDPTFIRPFSQQTVATAAGTITPGLNSGIVYWRVRAVTGTVKGPWSATGQFLTSTLYALQIPTAVDGTVPTTFPVYAGTTAPQTTVRLTLSRQASFSPAILIKTYTGSRSYVAMLDSLAPATTYYLKLEELNDAYPDLPTGLVNQLVQTFRTATAPLSNRWSFINANTVKDYPQSGNVNNVTFSTKGAWARHSKNLVRIDADSLVAYQYSRAATNGTLGNALTDLFTNGQGDIRVTTQLSVPNGSANPPYQTVRLSGQDGRILTKNPFNSQLPNQYNQYVDLSQRIFVDNSGIYELKDGKAFQLMALTASTFIASVAYQTDYCWVRLGDYAFQRTELIRITPDTKEIKRFNPVNTPVLSQHINSMTTDRFGNLWIAQSPPNPADYTILRFDGQNWTGFNRSNSPVNVVYSLAIDSFGSAYAVDEKATIYKYGGAIWQKVADLSSDFNVSYGLGTMNVDDQGKLWFSGLYDLVRYDPCPAIATPTLAAGSVTVNAGESVALRAGGCTSAVWSWYNQQETVDNRLLPATDPLVVKPESSTTYRVRCHADGCSGKANTVSVVVRPLLMLKQVDRRVLCPGDRLQATYRLRDQTGDEPVYRITIRNSQQSVTLVPTSRDSTLTVNLPTTLPGGTYWVNLITTRPDLRAADSIQITVRPLPTAELSSNKPTFAPGDSAQIAVALTGTAPWRFTRWDGQLIKAPNSPYTVALKATQPTTYSLTLTALSDANCAMGTVRNAITISALVLANESPAAAGITVFPNPTTGLLLIEGSAATAGMTLLRLTDGQGREVGRRQPVAIRSRRESWDISSLPAGLYILRIDQTDGNRISWKIVKQ